MQIINNVAHILAYVITTFDVPCKRKVSSKNAFTSIACINPIPAHKDMTPTTCCSLSDNDNNGNNKMNR